MQTPSSAATRSAATLRLLTRVAPLAGLLALAAMTGAPEAARANELQSGFTLCYLDRDFDAFGDVATERLVPWTGTAVRCQDLPADGEAFWISNGLDCDDDPARCGDRCRPGLRDVCDGWDNDCSAATADGADDDRNGFACDSPGDANACEDDVTGCGVGGRIVCINRPEGDESRVELCDPMGIDEDCDGFANDADPDGPPSNALRWYRDADGDGRGLATQSILRCSRPAGYSAVAGDCDDDPARCGAACAPGLADICDARDNDCDPTTPDGSADPEVGGACDSVQDGDECRDDFLVCSAAGLVCENNPDGDANRVERCDVVGIDEDCNGGANDNDPNGPPADAFTWYRDLDRDGFGRTDFFVRACVRPEGHVPVAGDCDDEPEGCGTNCSPIVVESRGAGNCEDGFDNDCDGLRDAGEACRAATLCYLDRDKDGYGDPLTERILPYEFKGTCRRYADAETEIGTLVDNGLDCNDADETLSPLAIEIVGNAIDENCDGMIRCLYDQDADGFAGNGMQTVDLAPTGADSDCSNLRYASVERGDCDDDPDRCGAACHPGATEICDGWDNDCNGGVDEIEKCMEEPPVIIDGSGGCGGGNAGVWGLVFGLGGIGLVFRRRRHRAPAHP